MVSLPRSVSSRSLVPGSHLASGGCWGSRPSLLSSPEQPGAMLGAGGRGRCRTEKELSVALGAGRAGAPGCHGSPWLGEWGRRALLPEWRSAWSELGRTTILMRPPLPRPQLGARGTTPLVSHPQALPRAPSQILAGAPPTPAPPFPAPVLSLPFLARSGPLSFLLLSQGRSQTALDSLLTCKARH